MDKGIVTAAVTVVFLAVGAYGTPATVQPGPEGDDTYVEYDEYTPQGDNEELAVRRGTDAQGLITCRAYIRFDLSDYSGIDVDEAELRLWSVYVGYVYPIDVVEVSNSWDEATLVWDDQPPFGARGYDLLEAGEYYYADVTTIVYNWLTLGTPNYGFVVKFENESAPNDGVVFYSGDNVDYPGKRPALLIWSPDLAVEPSSLGEVKAVFR